MRRHLGARLSLLRAVPATASWAPAVERRAWSAAAGNPTPPPPPLSPPGEAAEEERAASLPAAQLAKALLAGNVRGQLTTVAAGLTGKDETKVTSSVVSYLAPRGESPVVLLRRDDAQHLQNLQEAPKASLATGHISPPWFIERLRATGWLPRRVALLGSLRPLPPGELAFAASQAEKALRGAPALAAALPSAEQLAELAAYRLESVSRCVYVDAAGRQQAVPPEDADGALLDPLALPQHDLLAALSSADWQLQLQLFAAAYLGVGTSEVLLTQVDRLGFTLLGRPAGGEAASADGGDGPAAAQRWRQFRIGSSRELRDAEAFMALLAQMKEEVAAAAGKA